jgi:hypothetical protein
MEIADPLSVTKGAIFFTDNGSVIYEKKQGFLKKGFQDVTLLKEILQ